MSYLLRSITAAIMKPSETKDTTIIRTAGDPVISIEGNGIYVNGKYIIYFKVCTINLSFFKYEYCTHEYIYSMFTVQPTFNVNSKLFRHR